MKMEEDPSWPPCMHQSNPRELQTIHQTLAGLVHQMCELVMTSINVVGVATCLAWRIITHFGKHLQELIQLQAPKLLLIFLKELQHFPEEPYFTRHHYPSTELESMLLLSSLQKGHKHWKIHIPSGDQEPLPLGCNVDGKEARGSARRRSPPIGVDLTVSISVSGIWRGSMSELHAHCLPLLHHLFQPHNLIDLQGGCHESCREKKGCWVH